MNISLLATLTLVFLLMLTPIMLHADDSDPTPEISEIITLDAPHTVAYAMRGTLGNSNTHVGLGVICPTRGPFVIEVTAFFGSFPRDHRPVQLAVRTAAGLIERFGQIITAGPESGFHSPQLVNPRDAERFVLAALRPGALISNGYRSFWNRASEVRNREVRNAFLACLERGREGGL